MTLAVPIVIVIPPPHLPELDSRLPPMSSPDERHQSTTILAALIFLCLWASHYVSLWFPFIPGTLDLRHWLRFWNKPIAIHWPSAALFLMMMLWLIRLTQKRTLKSRNKPKSRWDGFLPME